MLCVYCGADDWFTHDDAVLCARCLSPKTIDAGSYEDYRAKTQAEDRLKRERFTSTDVAPKTYSVMWGDEDYSWVEVTDDGYGLAEYYDKMMDERPKPTHPPFWQLLK